MVFSLVDYDLHHRVLNNLTFTGDLDIRDMRLFASYEYRRSPYLTTRNALIGQPYEELSELEKTLLDLDLEDIAADRTAKSQTLRIGFNQDFSDRWSMTTDIVASRYSDTPASADVGGLDSSQTIYSSVQIRSNGATTSSSMTLRHTDSGTSKTSSMFLDSRYQLTDTWRIYPRLRVDFRSLERSGDEQWSVKPSLRVDHRYSRGLRFELEAGYEWSRREMATGDLDISGVYVRAGYRAFF